MNNITNQMPFPSQEFILNARENTFSFLCPEDPDMVLNSISNEQYEKDKFLPYWAEHWPSAEVMIPFVENSTFPEDYQICELGCGLGTISSIISKHNRSVFSVDISLHACIYAKENIRRNGGTPKVIVSDWRAMAFKNQFDLIIASDVLYEERWIDPILNCIKKLLKPDGKALIADPCRRFWNSFKQAAIQTGFSVKTIHSGTANNNKITVEIIECRGQRPETRVLITDY